MRETAEDRRESEAVTNARQRIALLADTYGIQHPEYATGLNQLALLLIMQGEPEGAEPLLRQALEIRRATLGERHPDYATNLSSLGGLLWARGDLDQAEPLLRQAVEVRGETLGPGHPKSVVSQNSLEQLLKAKREWAGLKPAQPRPSTQEPVAPPAPPVTPSPILSPSAASATPVPDVDSKAPVPVAETVPPIAASRAETPPAMTPASPGHHAEAGVTGVSEQLIDRLDRLKGEFAGLGDRLARVGEAMRTGTLPALDELLSAFSTARETFNGLQRDASESAQSHRLSLPEGGLTSLADLGALLPSLRDAEARRSAEEATRREALSVLDRLDRVSCPSDPAFAPLAACHSQSREIRLAVEGAGPGQIPDDARALIEGVHPLAIFLKLLTADASTGDTEWADWYDAVVASFGNPLAVAAARSRLVVKPS